MTESFPDLRVALQPRRRELSAQAAWVAEAVASRKLENLLAYRHTAPHARLSVPTTEHFDPLFVVLGMAYPDEPVETIFEGFHYGNLSMRSFSFAPQSDTVRPPTGPQSNQ